MFSQLHPKLAIPSARPAIGVGAPITFAFAARIILSLY
ncbi:Uncharacterised protein [Vibrio cholerae]|nr:Uncharacterised protein [Vibrio cholerae]